MQLNVARLDFSNRIRPLLAYSAGMALSTLAVVALYPAFKDSTGLDKFVNDDSGAAALFGVTGSLTSPAGWLNGNIYGNYFPLVMLLLTIAYGAAALAGQDEDGTLGPIVALPISRTAIVLEKLATMAVQAATLAAAVGVCVFAGRLFELRIAPGNVVTISVATALLGIDFGAITMAIGGFTGRRGTAIGIATALAAISFLLNSLAAIASWLHPARYLSLFYWSIGDNQLTKGVSPADYAVMLAVLLCAAYATALAFRRLDLH